MPNLVRASCSIQPNRLTPPNRFSRQTSSIQLPSRQNGTSSEPTNLAQKMANLPEALYTSYTNLGRQQWIILTQPANLTATASPTVDSLGLHTVLSLATIMMASFGVQEALASAQGGPGFNMAKFLNFLLAPHFRILLRKVLRRLNSRNRVLTEEFHQWRTSSLVDYIGNDSAQEVQTTIHRFRRSQFASSALKTIRSFVG
jgi:hypothetical protein